MLPEVSRVRRQLNFRILLITLVVLVAFGAAFYGVHAWQVDRNVASLLAYARQACVYPEGRALILYQSNLISVCSAEMAGLRERYQQIIEDTIAAGIAQGQFQVANAKLASLALFGSLYCIPLWYVPDGPLSPDEVGDYYASPLVGGLVTPLPFSR